MQRVVRIPIKKYIQILLMQPPIFHMIEGWAVEKPIIVAAITEYFEKLGINDADPLTEKKQVIKTIKSQLRHNMKILVRKRELKKLEAEASSRRKKQAN